jgi:cytochrome c55X
MLGKSIIFGLFLPALLYTCPVFASNTQIERQQELLYMLKHDCGSCHGMRLTGGLGPPLTRDALQNKNSSMLMISIAEGHTGTAMPAWKGILNDGDIAWLVSRLREGIQEY